MLIVYTVKLETIKNKKNIIEFNIYSYNNN